MLSPTKTSFGLSSNNRSMRSLLPKFIFAILGLLILYNLAASFPLQRITTKEPQVVPEGLYEGKQPDAAQSSGIPTEIIEDDDEETIDEWFRDALKPTPSPVSELEDASKVEDGSALGEDWRDVPVPTPTSWPTYSKAKELTSVDFNQTFKTYGVNQCMPPFNATFRKQAIARYVSCTEFAPFSPKETRRVGIASITSGDTNEAYFRAIETQMLHTAVHATMAQMHVLCDNLIETSWNKIAFLLNLIMNEMVKPEEERLEWMMWVDRDAMILDSCRPLSSFLPPKDDPAFDKINLITNEDAFGLNNGVFLFKVNRWSLEYFSTVLSYRYYRPDEQITFAEQTGMWNIMKEDRWKDGFVRVPWYWFNAYPVEGGATDGYVSGINPPEYFRARKGDFIAHFAGHGERGEEMPRWENMVAEMGNVWKAGGIQREISQEIKEYWQSWAKGTLTASQISGDPAAVDEEIAVFDEEIAVFDEEIPPF